MDKPKVAVVVLNWNGKGHLAQFLPSVAAQLPEYAQLYVADNASTDGSLDFVAEFFPMAHVVKLESNLGYAGGYNAALRRIEAEYFVLLNSDVEVVAGWIEPVIDFMEHNSQIGAAQPKILSFLDKGSFEYAGASGGFIDFLGFPFCRGRIFDHLEQDFGQYNTSVTVNWATGACLFVKAAAFWQVGGFDERFFAHMEEIDLCWRLQRVGYQVAAVPKATVYHLGGGTLSTTNPKKTFLNFRNSLWLMAKNWPAPYFYSLILPRLMLDGFASLKFLLEGNFAGVMAIEKAHWSFLSKVVAMRRHAPAWNAKLPNGVLKGSIVLRYFLKKQKRFSQLDGNLFVE